MLLNTLITSLLLTGCSTSLLNYDEYRDATTDTSPSTDTAQVTGTDTATSPATTTGMYGGTISFSLLQVSCPACFSLTNNIEVTAQVGIHEPISQSWLDWMPASGSCSNDTLPPQPNASHTDLGDWIYLETDAISVPMRETNTANGIVYNSAGLIESDFLRSTSYDLSVPDGGTMGAFAITDAITTPQGFNNITPSDLLLVNPQSAFSAPISVSGTVFGWAPFGGSGTFLIRVDEYAASGAYLRSALCRGPDTGTMTIPASAMIGMQTGNLVAVYLMRTNIGEAINPMNGSIIEYDVAMSVVGTGKLRP